MSLARLTWSEVRLNAERADKAFPKRWIPPHTHATSFSVYSHTYTNTGTQPVCSDIEKYYLT